tara:strand:- start:9169 stop:10302 length:1134 start_codon:yes stop_codon:yes gene_type:complete
VSDAADIEATLGSLYAGVESDEAWSFALDSVTELIGGVGCTFELNEKPTGRPLMLDFGARFAEVAPMEYLQHYGPMNPRVPSHLTVPVGSVLYDRVCHSEAEMDRDEFHADFLAKFDLRYFVSGVVLESPDYVGCIAIQRSIKQGHVDGDEIALMNRLMPHIQQVADIRLRLADARQRDATFVQGLEHLDDGVLIVDAYGRVLHGNAVAHEILSRDDGVTSTEMRLQFRDKSASSAFASALKGLAGGETYDIDGPAQSFPARRNGDARAYLVTVRAASMPENLSSYTRDAAAIVFLRDPSDVSDLDTQLLRQSYGLTGAETELASLIDRGLTLEEIAASRGVSITTVRTQLYSLMDKLGINRQPELTAILTKYRRLF